MWFNSIREEPYLVLTCKELSGNRRVPSNGNLDTGGAWLSSARVVRCWVKSRNERNPCPVLPAGYAGDLQETAGVNSEEGGDDVKSSRPLRPGPHTYYNARYSGKRSGNVEQIPKNRAKCRSWAAIRPREAGIASKRGSACHVEYVLGPCTHRPSHHGSP